MRFVKVIFSTVIVLLGIVFIIENLEVLKQAVRLKLDLYSSPSRVPTSISGFSSCSPFFSGSSPPPYTASTTTISSARPSASSGTIMEILAKELKQASATAQASAAVPEPQIAPHVRVIRGRPSFPGGRRTL